VPATLQFLRGELGLEEKTKNGPERSYTPLLDLDSDNFAKKAAFDFHFPIRADSADGIEKFKAAENNADHGSKAGRWPEQGNSGPGDPGEAGGRRRQISEGGTMTKRWIAIAVVAAGIAGPAAAQAPPGSAMPQMPQVYQPQFAGPPTTGAQAPQFAAPAVSAPTPQFCPDTTPGAASCDESCCVPKGSTNAFLEDKACPMCGVEADAGIFTLLRQSPGGKILGFQTPMGNPLNQPAPPGSPAALNAHDVDTDWHFGGNASVLIHGDQLGFEVCGFYTSYNAESNSSYTPAQPLSLGFAYNPTPPGFAGLWNRVDYTNLTIQSAMGDVEANFRAKTVEHVEFLVGVRYLDYQERYSIFTDTDSIITGFPDPARQANYSVQVHNRLAAVQVGCTCEKAVAPWLSLMATFKGGAGPNFAELNWSVQRGDNGAGTALQVNHNVVSQIYEVGLYANFSFNDSFKIKAGYQGLWLVDVPEAANNIDFNLTTTGNNLNTGGSIFFHGPTLQMEFSF
jgi:hypothetical protein